MKDEKKEQNDYKSCIKRIKMDDIDRLKLFPSFQISVMIYT